jgi:hypothetical protein
MSMFKRLGGTQSFAKGDKGVFLLYLPFGPAWSDLLGT